MRLFIFLIFFTFHSSFCQNYFFDNYIVFDAGYSDKIFLTNSENGNYLFYIYKDEDKLIGKLIDYIKNEYNFYDVFIENDDFHFKFKNQNKYSKNILNYVKRKFFNYKYEKYDSIGKFSLTKLKQFRNRKFINYFKTVSLKNEKRVFHVNHLDYLFVHNFLSKEDIKLSGKLPVTIECLDGEKFLYSLKKFEKINVTLTTH